MSIELIIAVSIAVLGASIIIFLIYRKIPKKLKTDVYAEKWKSIQSYCRDKSQWQQALIEADALLDMALKRRKFKGKSMGERMVSAQRLLTNNDGMWFAHNLYKKVLAEPKTRLKEADMKSALMGFRQALRDLGALDDRPKDTE